MSGKKLTRLQQGFNDLEQSLKEAESRLYAGDFKNSDINDMSESFKERFRILKKQAKKISQDVLDEERRKAVHDSLIDVSRVIGSREVQLRRVVEDLTAWPELEVEEKTGEFFLWNTIFKKLELAASIGFDDEVLEHCNNAIGGNCLCTTTLKNNDILFSGKDDSCSGQGEKGADKGLSVRIPINFDNGTHLGVLRLLLKKGKTPDDLDMVIINAGIEVIRKTVEYHSQRIISTLVTCREAYYDFSNFEEVYKYAHLLAHMCPNPEYIVTGFIEILTNSYEHGALGITCERKSDLKTDPNNSNAWKDEVDKLGAEAIRDGKYVSIHVKRFADRLIFTINDHGQGFPHEDFTEFKSELLNKGHGMGVMLSRGLFDGLEYNDIGNTVTLTVMIEKNDKYPVSLRKMKKKSLKK